MSRFCRLLRASFALSSASTIATLTVALPAQQPAAAPAAMAAPAAQDPAMGEHAAVLRAMVVLKLAPYIAPETATKAPPRFYRIAVVGDDPVAAAAQKELPGKKVEERTVEVVAVTPADAANGKLTHDCDLMYVAANVDEATLKRILEQHAARPVLVICERPGFSALGGGVQLFVAENSVRFEVNTEALKKHGLRASPQLLKLSRRGPK